MNDYFAVGIGLLVSLIFIVRIARLLQKRLNTKGPLFAHLLPEPKEEADLVLPDLPQSVPIVSYNENILRIGSIQKPLEATIKQVIPLFGQIIVQLDPHAGHFIYQESNLVAINCSCHE